MGYDRAHFGYLGRVQWFETIPAEEGRYVKIFAPNPTYQGNGTWSDKSGGAETLLFIESQLLGMFTEAFRQLVRSHGVSGDVEFV